MQLVKYVQMNYVVRTNEIKIYYPWHSHFRLRLDWNTSAMNIVGGCGCVLVTSDDKI